MMDWFYPIVDWCYPAIIILSFLGVGMDLWKLHRKGQTFHRSYAMKRISAAVVDVCIFGLWLGITALILGIMPTFIAFVKSVSPEQSYITLFGSNGLWMVWGYTAIVFALLISLPSSRKIVNYLIHYTDEENKLNEILKSKPINFKKLFYGNK